MHCTTFENALGSEGDRDFADDGASGWRQQRSYIWAVYVNVRWAACGARGEESGSGLVSAAGEAAPVGPTKLLALPAREGVILLPVLVRKQNLQVSPLLERSACKYVLEPDIGFWDCKRI